MRRCSGWERPQRRAGHCADPCSAVAAVSEAADLFPGGPGLSLDAREQMAARSDFPGEGGSGACWLFSLGSGCWGLGCILTLPSMTCGIRGTCFTSLNVSLPTPPNRAFPCRARVGAQPVKCLALGDSQHGLNGTKHPLFLEPSLEAQEEPHLGPQAWKVGRRQGCEVLWVPISCPVRVF